MQELDYDEFKLFIFAALDAQAELEQQYTEQQRLESTIRESPWVPTFMKAAATKLLN